MLRIELDTQEVRAALTQYIKSTFTGNVELADFKIIAGRTGESRIELSVDMFNSSATPVSNEAVAYDSAYVDNDDEDDVIPADEVKQLVNVHAVEEVTTMVEEPKDKTAKPLVEPEAELKPVPGSFFARKSSES